MELYYKTIFIHQRISNTCNHRANVRVLQCLFLKRLKGFLCSSSHASLPSKAPLHRGAPAAPHGTTTGDKEAPRQPATRGSRPRATALSPQLSKVLPSRSRRGTPPRHDACVTRAAPRTLPAEPRALEPPEGLPAPRH